MANYTGDLARYVLDRLFDNLTDKSYWNVDDWNNVDLLRIITRGSNTKRQLTIGVFSIAFAMSVIENFGEFLNTLTMQYELRYKWWINAVVMILSVPHCLCWLFYFQNIITFLFEKLTCAVEILIWSNAVDFLSKSLGMPYSVVTAQQACSTEMVNFESTCGNNMHKNIKQMLYKFGIMNRLNIDYLCMLKHCYTPHNYLLSAFLTATLAVYVCGWPTLLAPSLAAINGSSDVSPMHRQTDSGVITYQR